MHELNIEFQRNILINYIMSTEIELECDHSFINAIDLEIMNIAKNVIKLDALDLSMIDRAFKFIEERTEKDLIVTPRHLEVCKAVRVMYFQSVSENESARAVSCTTEFNEQTTNNYDVLDSIDEILKELSGKIIANKKLGKDE